MSDASALATLSAVPVLRRLDANSLQALASSMWRRDYDAGATVFRQGTHGHAMFLVTEGLLRVEYADRFGQTVVMGRVKPGEFVGEMAVLDPAPRSMSVIAATDSTLYGMARDDLDRLRKSTPAAESAIVAMIMRDLVKRTERLDDTISKTLGQSELPSMSKEEAEEQGVLGRMWARLTGGDKGDH